MTIQEIRDIVRIVRKYESYDQGLTFISRKDSKLAKFDHVVQKTGIQNDPEVARIIFGDKFTATKYKTLKSSYLSLLMGNLPFLAIAGSDLSEHSKAIFKSQKLLFYIRTLIALGNRPAANHFAKRLLSLTREFELYSVSVPILEELRYNAMQAGKKKEHARWSRLALRDANLLHSESQIKALEEEILIHFSKSIFVDENLKAVVKNALGKVKLILDMNETYFNRLSYYRLEYIFFQIEGDIKKSISACNRAIAFMTTKNQLTPPSRFAGFGLYKLENQILSRDFENGIDTVAYCLQHINKSMNLWFTVKEYEFLLMMQSCRFPEARTILNEVVAHDRFNSQSTLIREKWGLFEFNIRYVTKTQTANRTFQKSYLLRNQQFKSKVYDFPSYSKDKRGFNVAILILNILVLLEENSFSLLVEHEEALSSYRFKYLNETHCKQSFALFKLIRLMTKSNFDLKRIQSKSSPIESLLANEKLNPGEIFETIQIIPPQWVWDRIKMILASKKAAKIG